MTTVLKVSCPNCKHPQNYMPMDGTVVGKSKRCVYCGKTFKIHSNQNDSRIIGKA